MRTSTRGARPISGVGSRLIRGTSIKQGKGLVAPASSSLLKKVSGTFQVCEKPGICPAHKVPDTFFNRLLRTGRGPGVRVCILEDKAQWLESHSSRRHHECTLEESFAGGRGGRLG